MTTWYVRASGSNGNPGTSFGNAFATLGYALNGSGAGNGSLAAGDEIRVCADADHEVAAPILLNTTSGTPAARIRVTGANGTDGSVDGTRATIRPHVGALTYMFQNGGTIEDLFWQYLTFDARDSGGTVRCSRLFDLTLVNTSKRWRWSDCEFTRASGDNLTLRTLGMHFVRCVSSYAGGMGWGKNGTSDGIECFNCVAHNNGSHGFYFGYYPEVYKNCIAYANGGDGWNCPTGAGFGASVLEGCVSYGNTGSGFLLNNPTGTVNGNAMVNCSAANNGGHGLKFTNGAVTTLAAALQVIHFMDHNHSYGNTADTNIAGTTWTDFGISNIGGAPLFSDPSALDFSLLAGSPLIGAGIGGNDIGAVPYAAPGGGGGLALGRLISGGV